MDTAVFGLKTMKLVKKVSWTSQKKCFGHTTTLTTVGYNVKSPADVSAADKAVEKARKEETTEKAEGSLDPSAERKPGG